MNGQEEEGPAQKWAAVRAEFDQDPEYLNFTGFLLAPHPRPVREALARYREALDRNPAMVMEEDLAERLAGRPGHADKARGAAGDFLGVDPGEIALTDSTTMGLGLIYNGFRIAAGKEIVTTNHGHYSSLEALRMRAERDGLALRSVDLYENSAKVSVDEVVGRLHKAVTANTRLVAVTWVHSSTGVKMPIRAMADALAEINAKRDEKDRAFLAVDGVHGFGIEHANPEDLGCDVFIAGCHKWLFGPRGTGLVWARPEAWAEIQPAIAPFEMPGFVAWLQGKTPQGPGGLLNTPGGYHSFENRWALSEAFAFQASIGRDAIEQRVHELNTQLKEALGADPEIRLYTPMASELSAGITCFEKDGVDGPALVERLRAKKIIASMSPYRVSHPRLAPSLLNDPAEVDQALDALAGIG